MADSPTPAEQPVPEAATTSPPDPGPRQSPPDDVHVSHDASTAAHIHPDTFAEFMRMGDSSSPSQQTGPPPHDAPLPFSSNSASAAAQHSPRQQQPSGSPPINPGNFFSSMFRRATNSLESSLQAAQQNGTTAFSSATHHVSAASSSAISTVTGLVLDIGSNVDPPSSSVTPTHALRPLRLPQNAPALLILPAPVPTIVSATQLFIFSADSPRPQAVPLNIVQTAATGVTAPSPPHTAVRATHAAFLPAPPRLALAHDDGSLMLFSLSRSRVAAFEAATPPHPAMPTALAALPSGGLAVARDDGAVHLLDASLTPLAHVAAPEMCSAPLAPGLGTPGVTAVALAAAQADALAPIVPDGAPAPAAFVAFDDGVVLAVSATGLRAGKPFVAHAGPPAALATLLGGAVVVSAGGDTDRSLAVFDALSGRCLARRALQYAPTCIVRGGLTSDIGDAVCAAESAVLVGGAEGQVDVFRVLVLGPQRIEIKLAVRIGERNRGRKAVKEIRYRRETGVITTTCAGGEIRRWKLNRADAGQITLLEEERSVRAVYTEESVTAALRADGTNGEADGGGSGDGVQSTELSGVGGVIRAQSVLAAILDDESVSESAKDELVIEFQGKQGNMVSGISEAEKELRRKRRRLESRFAAGLRGCERIGPESDELEQVLARATKRAAAFEMEYARRRHIERVESLQRETVAELKAILKRFLADSDAGDSLIVTQARRDVETIDSEEVEVD